MEMFNHLLVNIKITYYLTKTNKFICHFIDNLYIVKMNLSKKKVYISHCGQRMYCKYIQVTDSLEFLLISILKEVKLK